MPNLDNYVKDAMDDGALARKETSIECPHSAWYYDIP